MPDGMQVSDAFSYTNITSTTVISTKSGSILGIFCASASNTPTLKVEDGAGTTIVNTFTPVGATWYQIPFRFGTALKVTVGGTVDCTVSWISP